MPKGSLSRTVLALTAQILGALVFSVLAWPIMATAHIKIASMLDNATTRGPSKLWWFPRSASIRARWHPVRLVYVSGTDCRYSLVFSPHHVLHGTGLARNPGRENHMLPQCETPAHGSITKFPGVRSRAEHKRQANTSDKPGRE